MGKRDRREGGKAEYPSTKANDLPENLSIASDSELDSDQEQDSDLPEETDSEAGLPSEESDSEAFDDNKEEDNSDKDELDQAILDVVETRAASDAQQDQTLPNRWLIIPIRLTLILIISCMLDFGNSSYCILSDGQICQCRIHCRLCKWISQADVGFNHLLQNASLSSKIVSEYWSER